MGVPKLKPVPVELLPEIRLVPPPVEVSPQPIPKNWPTMTAANTDVEIVETFASKFLRVGRFASRAVFWLQFLEFEGDTPHHSPAIDKPPTGTTVPEWLAEIEEMAKLAALIAAKQSEVMRHRLNGHEHLARLAEEDLATLETQVTTNIGSSPILGNRLQIKASSGGTGSFKYAPGVGGRSNADPADDKKEEDRVPYPALTSIRDYLNADEMGDLIIRMQDGTASFYDFVTVFATSPARFMGIQTIGDDETADESSRDEVALLNDPLLPVDVRVIKMLFIIQPPDELAQLAMAEAAHHAGDSVDAYAERVRAVYREFVPGAEMVLAAVDDYLQGQTRELAVATPLDIDALIRFVDVTRANDARASLSLLIHGEKIMQWSRINQSSFDRDQLNDPRYGNYMLQLQRALKTVYSTFGFSPEQQGMIVDLLRTDRPLAFDIVDYVILVMREDRELADSNLRQLYVANKPMGEYILAEYDRRSNLPEVRAKRAFDAAMTENGREKSWRKSTFSVQQNGGQAALIDAIQRALKHADNGDESQLKTLAAQWIDVALRDVKGTVQQLRGYTAEQDSDGYHSFSFFNNRAYDSAAQPFGFLLPHELGFWNRSLSIGHPTLQLLRQIERVHPDGFRKEYAALTDPEWFAEANSVIRNAVMGNVSGVDAAAIRELMRRSVIDPQVHVALLYWGASKPTAASMYDAWRLIPERVTEMLNYSHSRQSHVAGNILELVLRSADYDGVAELHAVKRYLGMRGNWVHVLPNDYARRQEVADLLVIGRTGEQTMVEVKNHLFRGRQDLTGANSVEQSLVKAASQLASTSRDYPLSQQVIYLRLAVPHSSKMPEEARQWIQAHIHDDVRFQNVAEVVVEVANAQDRTDYTSTVIQNEGRQTIVNGNARLAGPMEAQLLADRLVEAGIVRPDYRNLVLSQLAQAPKADVAHVLGIPPKPWRVREALDRYGLMPIVKPYLKTGM